MVPGHFPAACARFDGGDDFGGDTGIDVGVLNTRHDTELGDKSAASPIGRENSM